MLCDQCNSSAANRSAWLIIRKVLHLKSFCGKSNEPTELQELPCYSFKFFSSCKTHKSTAERFMQLMSRNVIHFNAFLGRMSSHSDPKEGSATLLTPTLCKVPFCIIFFLQYLKEIHLKEIPRYHIFSNILIVIVRHYLNQ